MSTPWTAPGAPGPSGRPDPDGVPASAPHDASASYDPNAQHGPSAPHGSSAQPGPSAPVGPRRELVQALPLFPLRPLGLGEVLGAAVRIYRLRPKAVLGVSAAVFGVAFVLITIATGASMVPLVGDMQAIMQDPEAEEAFGSVGDSVLLLLSSVVTGLFTTVASSLVTVALTRLSLGEATGEGVSSAEMWATMRRRGLPAIGVAIVAGILAFLAIMLPAALGALPLLLMQEASALTILPLLLGVLVGLLAAVWVWARTLLSVPALVLEEVGVLGALRRAFALTRGRRLWRVLGTGVLLYVLYTVATQVIGGVFGTVGGLLYAIILLAGSFETVLLGIMVLTVISMLGSYIAVFLLAPFLSAGIVAVYADARMRHEAWDIELTRRARDAWDGTGA